MEKKSKKKWIIIAALVIIFIIAFISCGGDDESGTLSNTTEKTDNSTKETSDNDFDVTEYSFCDTANSITQYVLIVKNNSSNTVSIDGNATALGENDAELDSTSDFVTRLEPEKETCMIFEFSTRDAKSFKYSLDYENTRKSEHIGYLDFKETQNDNNVIVSCKNTSSDDVEFINVRMMFFMDNTFVGSDSTYIGNDDAILKSNQEKSGKLECIETFNNYKVFYSAD